MLGTAQAHEAPVDHDGDTGAQGFALFHAESKTGRSTVSNWISTSCKPNRAVSGGHTKIWLQKGVGNYICHGESLSSFLDFNILSTKQSRFSGSHKNVEVYKKVQETTLATVSQLVFFIYFNVLSIAQRCLRTNHIIIQNSFVSF